MSDTNQIQALKLYGFAAFLEELFKRNINIYAVTQKKGTEVSQINTQSNVLSVTSAVLLFEDLRHQQPSSEINDGIFLVYTKPELPGYEMHQEVNFNKNQSDNPLSVAGGLCKHLPRFDTVDERLDHQKFLGDVISATDFHEDFIISLAAQLK